MTSLNDAELKRQSAALRSPSWDDLNRRRELFKNAANGGRSVGYLLLVIACIAAFVALLSGFRFGSGLIMSTALIASIAVLPLSMIIGYGIRAAEREDQQFLEIHAKSQQATEQN